MTYSWQSVSDMSNCAFCNTHKLTWPNSEVLVLTGDITHTIIGWISLDNDVMPCVVDDWESIPITNILALGQEAEDLLLGQGRALSEEGLAIARRRVQWTCNAYFEAKGLNLV